MINIRRLARTVRMVGISSAILIGVAFIINASINLAAQELVAQIVLTSITYPLYFILLWISYFALVMLFGVCWTWVRPGDYLFLQRVIAYLARSCAEGIKIASQSIAEVRYKRKT